jgi:hypothetical protein
MKTTILPLALSFCLLPTLSAQDATQQDKPQQDPAPQGAPDMAAMLTPAPQLKKLAPMLGHWLGGGDYTAEAGQAPMPWKSKAIYDWTHGGHWMRERMEISMGPGMPPMQWTAYMGWDRSQGCFVSYAYINTGEIAKTQLKVTDDGRVFSGRAHLVQGQFRSEHSVATYGANVMSFKSYMAVDGGESFLHVQGKYDKVEPFEMEATKAFLPMGDASCRDHIRKITKIAGKYRMDGKWRMTPEAEPMPVGGDVTIERLYQGAMLHMTSTGEPAPGSSWVYEDTGVVGWSAAEGCYVLFFVSNMGEAAWMRGAYDAKNKRISFFSTHKEMGELTSMRSHMQLGDDGSVTSFGSVQLKGSAAAFVPFEASYKKLGK